MRWFTKISYKEVLSCKNVLTYMKVLKMLRDCLLIAL